MFKDLFSQQSSDYAKYRPEYPDELFEFIIKHVEHRETCWDCATGNGQAAVSLAKYFTKVIATDASSQQLRKAVKLPNITYHLTTEKDSLLLPHSVDLITVAQAIHWFDFNEFYREVRRVSKSGVGDDTNHGQTVIAVWGYGLQHISLALDPIIEQLYSGILGKYWSPERKLVDESYTTIPFPFKEIKTPAFEMKVKWNLFEFVGYLNTWSSVQNYKNLLNSNPLDLITEELAAAWGEPEEKRIIRWPLFLRMGKV